MRELGAISEAHRLKPVPSRIWYSHAMPQFAPNQMRFDPHRNFKFRVKWDDQYVAGISKVGALSRTTEVVEDQEGGDPTTSRKSPGRTVYDAITLERGLTRDLAFENWANSVWNLGDQSGSEAPPREFRKDIIIEVYGEDDQLVRAYKVYRCWPLFYQVLPVFDTDASAVTVEKLSLANEGWERDSSIVEPRQH
jgi:phage tail-like protein